MGPARSTFHVLLVLLVASLIPALFLLDHLVQRAGRATWLQADLEVRLDGQEALALSAPLGAEPGALPGLSLGGAALLREGRYPWAPTSFEGRFTLRLAPALLASVTAGPRREGFAASYTVRQTERPDGLGPPPVPCVGTVNVVERSARVEPPTRLEDLDVLLLELDLLCTSAGPDLAWGSGDERTWAMEGPLRLRRGRRPSP